MSATTTGLATPSPPAERSGAGSKRMLIGGGVSILIALVLLAAGAVAVWALAQRDKAGYFTTERHLVSTPSYAFVSRGLDVGQDAPGWIGDLAGVRLEASSREPVFIGIGRTSDVARYLAGVQHAQVTDVDADPLRLTSHQVTGTARPAPPSLQPFWRAQASGPGLQTIKWPLEKGDWSAVAMNADGSRHVAIALSAGARIPALRWFAICFLTGGTLLLLGGATLIYVGARRR